MRCDIPKFLTTHSYSFRVSWKVPYSFWQAYKTIFRWRNFVQKWLFSSKTIRLSSARRFSNTKSLSQVLTSILNFVCILTFSTIFDHAQLHSFFHVDLGKGHVNRSHQPLESFSGHFSGPQPGWSTPEKESYTIMGTVTCGHMLPASSDRFDFLTDHQNLILLFETLVFLPNPSHTILQKVLY